MVQRLKIIRNKIFDFMQQRNDDFVQRSTIQHKQIQRYVIGKEETLINNSIHFLHERNEFLQESKPPEIDSQRERERVCVGEKW